MRRFHASAKSAEGGGFHLHLFADKAGGAFDFAFFLLCRLALKNPGALSGMTAGCLAEREYGGRKFGDAIGSAACIGGS
jgi:hypothetical protein